MDEQQLVEEEAMRAVGKLQFERVLKLLGVIFLTVLWLWMIVTWLLR